MRDSPAQLWVQIFAVYGKTYNARNDASMNLMYSFVLFQLKASLYFIDFLIDTS